MKYGELPIDGLGDLEKTMRQAVRLRIYAEWKKEAKVWVASSSDICGLSAEAGTLQALEDRLKKIIPETLEIYVIKGEAALIVNNDI